MREQPCTLTVRPEGSLIAIYTEALDLVSLGDVRFQRASHVEPDERGNWWADLSPVHGPILGPFTQRSQALEAEHRYLMSRLEHGPGFDPHKLPD